MIVTTLTYKKPLSEVQKYLNEHIVFLEKFYAKNIFLASGRRDNRIGGVIIVLSKYLKEVKKIMAIDPFYKHEIADYSFIRFEPTKYLDEIKNFI
ncbi:MULTISPECIES: YciI family protein [unclassified Psychrobacter]|uniref:YciI family protein n=1 Tax=unclassified Psychrobacter TaxID=196806 RepID=UPI0025B4A10A|nr:MULTISPECIES: YciI family protein [unclassified Psychrobacter]MDN3453550.1 YciI family protein [Psychrobacter sp. APC 3350]MDN3503376.1 YciI family protein [Psychrobacter sp. 5A.1]